METTPEPTAQDIVNVLQQSHPDAVAAAYWQVKARILESLLREGDRSRTLQAVEEAVE